MTEPVEEMAAFFARRVEDYDRHMLEEVEGCREGYSRLAAQLPLGLSRLLDLGCGTGLELEAVFARFPQAEVTAWDVSAEMLERACCKFAGRRLRLFQGDYLQQDFGEEEYDAAISFQTMHHFSPDRKRDLYARVLRALKRGGVYLEGDYMAASREEEKKAFAHAARLRAEQGIAPECLMHLDIPCAEETQHRLLREAGFSHTEKLFRQGNTTLLLARK